MTSFTRQRWVGTLLFLAASVVAVWTHLHFRGAVSHWYFVTGWVLLAVMLVVALYNARKKLPFLPMISSEGWLQFHIYAGFFTGTLFLVHVDFRWPNGWFESSLAWIYFLVMASGVFGLVISRVFPQRLSIRGGEVFFEQIPTLRHHAASEAETLALASIPESSATTIADFYERRLRAFFAAPRHFWLHLMDSRRPLNTVLDDINDLRRYLNEKERGALTRLEQLVRQKDGLDYHHALQSMLKLWLFVHLPLTYSLLLFTAAHVVIVYAFSGGAK
ncbi:MAG TPA: hypothetical protein VI454_21205 [Verrucomicrobiae bacterium]|jgi:hypothetical protein